METLISNIVAFVTEHGGKVLWSELIEFVPYEDRQRVPQALQVAKSRQLLKRVLKRDAEAQANVHTVELWGNE